MASLGQIIFYTMIILIVIFAAFIILILALAFSGAGSRVQSTNTSPIGNLSDDVLLSCYLNTNNHQAVNDISVTWKKANLAGLVYKYQNGAPDLTDQNSQFKGRTLPFLDKLMTGNASLLLKGVRNSDRGEYTCSISYSEGTGEVNIYLRTAAFSAPTFTLLQGILATHASWWFPKPNVTWSDYDGKVLLGNNILTESSTGIFSVVSTLQPVNNSGTYTCSIENNLLISISQATITGSNVSWSTYFTYSTASSLLASTYLITTTSILCIYYLI
ncbi:hypothetical protein D5F01_LYC02149 [Larimichthys crocea]|uniref:Ig-like domain-containing protein n=1 Tax=Larimichthys crocea TaxID=215358 RepID=A0A6G0J811_LARCR|nr:hypothetical protein D5F01_LYC02149 [Larimichthys crocea]